MKEVLKVLRDLRIETSERGNYSQSYANGYTDAISDAIQAVKKMDYIPCCKSDSEQLCDCAMPDPINPWDSVDKDTCRKCENKIA
ncbi:MAG: hypothetical protein ACKVIG_12140 [Flavobacteriales bacterium]